MLAELPPPGHGPARAREAADEILRRPEYHWSEGGDGLLDRVGEWVAEQFDRLTSPFGAGAGWLSQLLAYLVVALVIGLAVFVGVLLYRSRAGWRGDRPVVGSRGVRVVVTGDDDPIDWAAEAARCEAEGLWREALRARYRVLVGDLARRGIIGDLVGRTAGELVAEVRAAAPAIDVPFTAATELFEAAWYGGAPVGGRERDRFARLAEESRAGAAATATPRVPA